MVYMHRAILCVKDDAEVDHRNGDKLDNRRENLRLSTHSQNGSNKAKQRNNTTGFKGVTWNKLNQNWNSQIAVDGKRIHIGCHDTAEEAAKAYDKKAVELFGEFALLNFPKESL